MDVCFGWLQIKLAAKVVIAGVRRIKGTKKEVISRLQDMTPFFW
jgi:hypothetical protein